MLKFRFWHKDESPVLLEKVAKGTVRSLRRAGAFVRTVARRSIRQRKTKAPEGQPPHTRRGAMRRAILFGVEPKEGTAVIGPAKSKFGTAGVAHELGGRYRKEKFPRRSTMGPALTKSRSKIASFWRDSAR